MVFRIFLRAFNWRGQGLNPGLSTFKACVPAWTITPPVLKGAMRGLGFLFVYPVFLEYFLIYKWFYSALLCVQNSAADNAVELCNIVPRQPWKKVAVYHPGCLCWYSNLIFDIRRSKTEQSSLWLSSITIAHMPGLDLVNAEDGGFFLSLLFLLLSFVLSCKQCLPHEVRLTAVYA